MAPVFAAKYSVTCFGADTVCDIDVCVCAADTYKQTYIYIVYNMYRYVVICIMLTCYL